jgi:hypothetical protein
MRQTSNQGGPHDEAKRCNLKPRLARANSHRALEHDFGVGWRGLPRKATCPVPARG